MFKKSSAPTVGSGSPTAFRRSAIDNLSDSRDNFNISNNNLNRQYSQQTLSSLHNHTRTSQKPQLNRTVSLSNTSNLNEKFSSAFTPSGTKTGIFDKDPTPRVNLRRIKSPTHLDNNHCLSDQERNHSTSSYNNIPVPYNQPPITPTSAYKMPESTRYLKPRPRAMSLMDLSASGQLPAFMRDKSRDQSEVDRQPNVRPSSIYGTGRQIFGSTTSINSMNSPEKDPVFSDSRPDVSIPGRGRSTIGGDLGS